MNDQPKMAKSAEKTDGPDYSKTLFLPKTDFPMRAGLPKKEPSFWRAGPRSASISAYVRPPPGGRNSCCTMAHPMPMATSISATR